MLSTLLSPMAARATEPGFQSVEECIEVCQDALDAADVALGASQDELRVQKEINALLESRLREAGQLNQELTERQSAWHRDPKTMMTLGLVGGLLLGALLNGQK